MKTPPQNFFSTKQTGSSKKLTPALIRKAVAKMKESDSDGSIRFKFDPTTSRWNPIGAKPA